jgi:hypothetical protein
MGKPTVPPPSGQTQSHPLLIAIIILAVIGVAAWLVLAMKSTAPSPQEATAANAPASTAPATTSVQVPTPATSAPAAATEPPPSAPDIPFRPAAKKVPAKGPLPPLPMLGFAPPRPIDVVQAVFEFAARRPDVLEYVPCFCGCERQGHVGNDDCFVQRRDAEGNVEWEPHGMS